MLDAVHSIQEPEPVEIVVVDDASRDDATHRDPRPSSSSEGVRVIRQDEQRRRRPGAHGRARRDHRAARGRRSTATTCAMPGRPHPRWPTASTPPPTPRPASATTRVRRPRGAARGPGAARPLPRRATPTSTRSPPSSAATGSRRSTAGAAPRPRSRATRTGACGWTSPSAAGRSRTSARAASATAAASTAAASTTRRASTTARSTARCAPSHPQLFADLPEHRRRSDLSGVRKLLYPLVYGERARVPFEDVLKPIADRFGIWTLTRR